MAFQKGQSGNPKGRRKGSKNKQSKSAAEITALARGHSVECIERPMYWVRSDKSRESVQAAKTLLERAWGMPPSHVESTLMLTTDDGSGDKIEVTFVHPMLGPDGEPLRTMH
jgi:Family of unknown function (DUF5681)